MARMGGDDNAFKVLVRRPEGRSPDRSCRLDER